MTRAQEALLELLDFAPATDPAQWCGGRRKRSAEVLIRLGYARQQQTGSWYVQITPAGAEYCQQTRERYQAWLRGDTERGGP